MENSGRFNSAANKGQQSTPRNLSDTEIRARRLTKNVSNMIRDGQWQRAYQTLRSSGFLTSNDPFILFQAAQVCLNLKNPQDAEGYLSRVLATDPNNYFCLQLMGDVLVEKGDYGVAEAYYFLAIKGAKKDPKGRPEVPMGKMIQALRLQGCNEDALRITENLNDQYPRDIYGWRLKCEILRDLGRFDEALKTLEHLRRQYPHNSTFADLQRDIAHQAGDSGHNPFSPAAGPA